MRTSRGLRALLLVTAACGGAAKPSPFDRPADPDPVIAAIELTRRDATPVCPGARLLVALSGRDTTGKALTYNWLAPAFTIAPAGVELGTYRYEEMELEVSVPSSDPAVVGVPLTLTATLKDHPDITTSLTLAPDAACTGGASPLEFIGELGGNGADGTATTKASGGVPGTSGLDTEVEVAAVTTRGGIRQWLVVARVVDETRLHARLVPANGAKVAISTRGGAGGDGGIGHDDDGRRCAELKPGGKGGDGGDGGALTVRGATAEALGRLELETRGGFGGKGGLGGIQCADASASGLGKPGKPGKDGKAGKVTTKVVPAARLALIAAYLAEHPELTLAGE